MKIEALHALADVTVNGNGVYHVGRKPSAGDVGTYTKAEIDSKDNTKLNLSGGTMTGPLAIKSSASSFQGMNIESTADGWSFLQLKATTGTAHIAVNTNAIDGGAAGALHLRPYGQKNGSLIIQNNAVMRHQTATGYWEVGSQNSSHCHYNTDRPNHWFNKEVKVNGEIYCGASYTQRVYHQGFKPTAADVGALPSGGTAAAATKLVTPRAINGVNFDGSANITITAAANGGTSAACSGNAATATTLQTARTINGVSFNGSTNITITAAANGGTSSACSGNAATATKLATARTIGGTNFDGTANIDPMRIRYQDTRATEFTPATARTYLQVTFQNGNSNGVGAAATDYYNLLHIPQYSDNSGGYGSQIAFTKDGKMRHRRGISDTAWGSWNVLYSTGNKPTAADVGALASNGTAVAATKLATARNIALSGDATGSVNFDGTGNVTIPVVVADNSHNHAWSNITGAPATATRWPTVAEVGAAAASHTHSYAPLTGAGTSGTWPINISGNALSATNATSATSSSTCSGNSATASKLLTARAINGVNFDGSANITITAAANGGTSAACSGNSATATKLATPRAINGTNFDGSAAITTANWGTVRTLTIGNTGKSVNGSANVSWNLGEIGAASSSHTHAWSSITSRPLVAEVTTSSDRNLLDYPVGTVVFCSGYRAPGAIKNASAVVYAWVGSNTADIHAEVYSINPSYSTHADFRALAGTWRAKGSTSVDGGGNFAWHQATLMQRVA